jgi:phenylacetate-CoA ligase
MSKVVRVHASSGTTGKPTVVGYTRGDLDRWTDMVARVVVAGGATEDDIVQIAFGYGLFTGALGLHYGLERVGATIVPTSSGNTEKQLMLMEDFGTTALVATPSYALYMSELAHQHGIAGRLKLRVGFFFGSEAAPPRCGTRSRKLRHHRHRQLRYVRAYRARRVRRMPGAQWTAYLGRLFFARDYRPQNRRGAAEGETGELVITPLTKEALPLLPTAPGHHPPVLRALRLRAHPCAHGQNHGRSDDMLIIKGVNVFPSQIESVLLGMEHIGPHYLLVFARQNYMDNLEVQLELINGMLLERFGELQSLEQNIRARLHTVLGLTPRCSW